MFDYILAGLAFDAAGGRSAACVGALAAVSVLLLGSPLLPALEATAPVLGFLAAALTLAAAAHRAGLAERLADRVALLARGHSTMLYAIVCLVAALATAVVSLDGAVVLMVPLLLALARRHGAPLAPLLLGTVAVANAASVAVPQGNPTNLVVIERLGIGPADFLAQMLVPGLAAVLVCAGGAGLFERHALAQPYSAPTARRNDPLSPTERHMITALAVAALVGWVSPFAGVPAWWTFTAVAAVAVLAHPRPRPRPALPVRLAVQLTGLLVLIGALDLTPDPAQGARPAALLSVAVAVGVVAALANNLPASVSVGSLLGGGPSAYAATIGLGVGALATPQGSVATLLAAQLAGPDAPPLRFRRLAPLALSGVVAATLTLTVLHT